MTHEARDKMGLRAGTNDVVNPSDDDEPKDRMRRVATRCWAMLLARIYECLPLLCPKCGKPMRIIAFMRFGPECVRNSAEMRNWGPNRWRRLLPCLSESPVISCVSGF